MIPFEDTWLDIICKAMRGLNLSTQALAQAARVPEEKIILLLEGNRNDATLIAIAPALGLRPRELVMAAAGISDIISPTLPKNFHCFTSTYHDMQVHSYLLWSEKNKKAVAFDTGTEISTLLERLKQHQLVLDAIFLTHSHADHVSRLSVLVKKTGAVAWINSLELMKKTRPLPLHFSYALDETITIKPHFIPGHSPGGTAYLIHGLSTPIAVVGDTIFACSVGGMAPTVYTMGLKNIYNQLLLLSPATILAPGHGPLTTVKEERDKNPFFA